MGPPTFSKADEATALKATRLLLRVGLLAAPLRRVCRRELWSAAICNSSSTTAEQLLVLETQQYSASPVTLLSNGKEPLILHCNRRHRLPTAGIGTSAQTQQQLLGSLSHLQGDGLTPSLAAEKGAIIVNATCFGGFCRPERTWT